MIPLEFVLVAEEKIPVEAIEWTGQLAQPLSGVEETVLAIVAHPLNVVTRGSIRFGGNKPSISILTHS